MLHTKSTHSGKGNISPHRGGLVQNPHTLACKGNNLLSQSEDKGNNSQQQIAERTKFVKLACLFVFWGCFRPTQEFFTHMETSSLLEILVTPHIVDRGLNLKNPCSRVSEKTLQIRQDCTNSHILVREILVNLHIVEDLKCAKIHVPM